MEITTRVLWTLLQGIGFGALYLLACLRLLRNSEVKQEQRKTPAQPLAGPNPLSGGARQSLFICLCRFARFAYLPVGDASRVLFMQLMVQLVDQSLCLLESFSSS